MRLLFFLGGESHNDIAVDRNPQIHAVFRNASNALLLDAFFHEVHHALIERLEAEHELEAARIPHECEQIARKILFKPHLGRPLNVQFPVENLLTHPLRRRQREALVCEEEVRRAVFLRQHLQIINRLAGVLLSEILVIERQGAKGAVLVIAPPGELNRQDGRWRQITSQRKSVIVWRGKGVDIFGIKRLIDRDLAVLAVDQIGYLAKIAFAIQLSDQFKQCGLSLEHDKVIGQIKEARAPPQIIDQPSKDTPPDRQMKIGVRLLD